MLGSLGGAIGSASIRIIHCILPGGGPPRNLELSKICIAIAIMEALQRGRRRKSVGAVPFPKFMTLWSLIQNACTQRLIVGAPYITLEIVKKPAHAG